MSTPDATAAASASTEALATARTDDADAGATPTTDEEFAAHGLNGSWKLDWSRGSEKAYNFFMALGVPFLVRPLVALADSMTPTYHLSLTAAEWTIRGGITPSVDRFFFHAPSEWAAPDGGRHPATVAFEARGELVIRVTHTAKPIDVVMIYRLIDGGAALVMDFALLERASRKVVQAFKRTYTRVAAGAK